MFEKWTRFRSFLPFCVFPLLLSACAPHLVGSPVLAIHNAWAQPGSTISLDVTIANNPGIMDATLVVDYDPGLTLTNIANGDVFKGLEMAMPNELASGCKIGWSTKDLTNGQAQDGIVMTLTFKVPESAADGESFPVQVSSDTDDEQVGVHGTNHSTVDLKPAGCVIAVGDGDTRVAGLSIDKKSVFLDSVGATEQLTAVAMPDSASDKSVTWKSYNEAVATVSAEGVVTAVGKGEAVIEATAADGECVDTCKVVVGGEFKASITTTPVKKGDYTAFDCMVEGVDATACTFRWQYSANGDDVWTDSSAPTASTPHLRVKATRARIDGWKFRCVVGYKGTVVFTDAATIEEVPRANPLAIMTEPADVVGKHGSTQSATVVAKGDGLLYQWYFRATNYHKWIASGFETGKSATIEIPINETNVKRVYKCVVTDSEGEKVETREVHVSEL